MNAAWAAHLPAGQHPADLDLTGRRSLPAAWREVWAASPERNVVTDASGRSITAAQLEEATSAAAGRFAAAGLAPGDRVLMSAEASIDLVVAHVAALRAGLVVVPANTAYREREIAHLVSDSTPRLAIVDSRERAAWITSTSASTPVVGTDIDLPAGPPPPLDQAGPADPALIGYTSGTTGAPKGAVLTHANLLAGSSSVGIAWRWDPSDVLVLALPLFHAHGLCVGLHGTLLAGARAVLLPRFDVDAVLDAAAQAHATLFFGVPTMYHRLAASARVGELSGLRLCVSGSAALPAALHEALAVRAGQRVLERYGMTETLMNVSNPYDGERRPGSVGLPLPGVEVTIDGGEKNEKGETGEILVRGPNVFARYWQREEATAEAFRGGWFATGDLGAFDDDGYLRILGRAKELIISGGFNVYPREVEEVLLDHPAVAEAAVVGTPSDEWGEVVTAYLVASGPLDEDELTAFTTERLAGYKRPRIVRFVDALPRNALGKIMKHELEREGRPSGQH